ncbi:hypothetical protein OB905_11725 [Halobacteria archaeon AArc-dxtr1]|nr:hypothetical protein [Halobacteria archaeon AArc-dxtr1]
MADDKRSKKGEKKDNLISGQDEKARVSETSEEDPRGSSSSDSDE